MATTANTIETGLYLYAIIAADGATPIHARGVEGGTVEQLVVGSVAAIVSRVAAGKIRPQRSNLAAHNQILADQQAVLPVAFGTVVDSEQKLRDVLYRNHDAVADRLRLLQGKVEMSLKVYWETTNIFEYFVAGHEELKQMRDRMFRPGRMPAVAEKIKLGTLFESLLQESRERHTDRVTKALSPYCAEIRTVDVGDEKLIMKLACLVDRKRQLQWEKGVEEAARQFDNNYCFKYGNPMAPYSFTDIDLELGETQ